MPAMPITPTTTPTQSPLDQEIAALHQEFLLLQSENQKLETKKKLEGEIRQLRRANEELAKSTP
jgi:hypothetical protein